jgi:hypothetical protein
MAELVVEGDQLVLRLSWWEKIAAFHGNIRAPISSIGPVSVKARAADAYRPPSFRTLPGTWKSLDYGYGVRGYRSDSFVALRQRRRRPAVLVYLHPPSRFHALLVTVADPEATAARIKDAKRAAGS